MIVEKQNVVNAAEAIAGSTETIAKLAKLSSDHGSAEQEIVQFDSFIEGRIDNGNLSEALVEFVIRSRVKSQNQRIWFWNLRLLIWQLISVILACAVLVRCLKYQ